MRGVTLWNGSRGRALLRPRYLRLCNLSRLGEGIAAAAEFGAFDAGGEAEIAAATAAGAIVHAEENALVFGQQGVAGVAGRQGADDFDDAGLAHGDGSERERAAEEDVGEGGGVFVAGGAIDEHRTHLLDHAIEVEMWPGVVPSTAAVRRLRSSFETAVAASFFQPPEWSRIASAASRARPRRSASRTKRVQTMKVKPKRRVGWP